MRFSGTAITIIGTAKMLRQPSPVTSAPHTTGANAGPNVIVQLPIDRYVPVFSRGTTTRIAFIISGMKMPVPTAWIRRATRSTAKLPAKNPSADPAKLSPAAQKNSTRSLTRRKRNAMHVTTTVATIM